MWHSPADPDRAQPANSLWCILGWKSHSPLRWSGMHFDPYWPYDRPWCIGLFLRRNGGMVVWFRTGQGSAGMEYRFIPSHFQPYTQVTWLVVTEVRSESFGLVTERRHEIGRAMCHCRQSYFCHSLVSAACKGHPIFSVECGIARFLCAVRVFAPRPPLCQGSFPSRPPLLSYPMEKNRLLNQPITQLI